MLAVGECPGAAADVVVDWPAVAAVEADAIPAPADALMAAQAAIRLITKGRGPRRMFVTGRG
jgi:hypothetical protein